MGPQVLGGVDWSPYYADWWAAAESYTALFTMLAITQVEGSLWDWPQYTAFTSINEGLYKAPPSMVIIPEVLEESPEVLEESPEVMEESPEVSSRPTAGPRP